MTHALASTLAFGLATWLIEYLLNSLWQLPLVFAAAFVASRIARPNGPGTQHRIWVTAMIAATILPACNLDLRTWLQQALAFVLHTSGNSTGGNVRIVFGAASAQSSGLNIPPALAFGVISLYFCLLLLFAMRLALGLRRTQQIRDRAQLLANDHSASAAFRHLRNLLQFPYGRLAVSPAITGPATIGARKPTLIFPSGFLESVSDDDLNTVLAHELAHMQRHDFAKNLLYEVLTLPLAFHPVLWLIRSRIAETREMICDEMAARATAGQDRYARSLLRLAAMLTIAAPRHNLHAIGILDANNFERRVMNLTRNHATIARSRKLLIAAACAVIALGTCASAIALHTGISAAQTPSESPKKVHVKSDDLKIVSKVNPVYPVEAKKAGIQGTVVLTAIIGKDGTVERLSVESGPKELQQSALDAVHQWRYEPFLLNGDPIEVETTINVVYQLAG